MPTPERHPLVTAVERGQPIDHAVLGNLPVDERDRVVAALLETTVGRRWLRTDPTLDTDLADRLLASDSDFRQSRRDRTLRAVVALASAAALIAHAEAIAGGSAATALWERLADHPNQLLDVAGRVVSSAEPVAAAATLYLLILDPLDPFRLGNQRRSRIATRALDAADSEIRGLASEFLSTHDPPTLVARLDRLATDESERVRGIAWSTALRENRPATAERAIGLLGSESVPIAIRRSALVALGTTLPTAEMIDLLALLVVHPDRELAVDAANLLDRYHRNPIAAEAARDSPHAEVREVAERLLDPLRGSPAAGGSRPGDPTRSSADIYAEMIRQLEERIENRQSDPER